MQIWDFHGALLCKEINCLAECLEVTVRKTRTKKRNSKFCNKEKCCDIRVVNVLMSVTGNLLFRVKYSHEHLSCSSDAVV